MTTSSENSSPFQDNTSKQAIENHQEFSFQTMADDLLYLQKNGKVEDKKQPEAITIEKITPIVTASKQPIAISSEKITSNNQNPFLDEAVAPIALKKEMLNPELSASTKPAEVFHPKTNSSQTSNSTHKILMTLIVFLIIGIAGLGGYYFWMTQNSQEVPVEQPSVVEAPAIPEPTPTQIEEPVVIAPPIEKYSTEKPNYLSLDLANLSAEEIKTNISTVANEIKDKNNALVYEFTVVDSNNNPIAFPIFATAAKLNLAPTLLSSLGEDFSLFIYNDNDNIRTGLSIAISRANILAAELQKQEKTFVADASFLFLDAKPETSTGIFTITDYKNTALHYLNVNPQKNLSIDYAIVDSQLIIATSKNTGRALLDKLFKEKNAN
jgi:hypothetical protein